MPQKPSLTCTEPGIFLQTKSLIQRASVSW